jgi:hypothetical protein
MTPRLPIKAVGKGRVPSTGDASRHLHSGEHMKKKPVRGDRKALLEAKKLTIQPDISIQPGQPDCLVVVDSDAGATINPHDEEEIGLFRPRLHWISE